MSLMLMSGMTSVGVGGIDREGNNDEGTSGGGTGTGGGGGDGGGRGGEKTGRGPQSVQSWPSGQSCVEESAPPSSQERSPARSLNTVLHASVEGIQIPQSSKQIGS